MSHTSSFSVVAMLLVVMTLASLLDSSLSDEIRRERRAASTTSQELPKLRNAGADADEDTGILLHAVRDYRPGERPPSVRGDTSGAKSSAEQKIAGGGTESGSPSHAGDQAGFRLHSVREYSPGRTRSDATDDASSPRLRRSHVGDRELQDFIALVDAHLKVHPNDTYEMIVAHLTPRVAYRYLSEGVDVNYAAAGASGDEEGIAANLLRAAVAHGAGFMARVDGIARSARVLAGGMDSIGDIDAAAGGQAKKHVVYSDLEIDPEWNVFMRWPAQVALAALHWWLNTGWFELFYLCVYGAVTRFALIALVYDPAVHRHSEWLRKRARRARKKRE